MLKQSEYNRRWRQRHPRQWQRIRQRAEANRDKRLVLTYHTVVQGMVWGFLKAVKEAYPCADCGRYDTYYTMEWDHTQTKQRPSPGACRNWPEMWRELELCDLVCCRCHRIRTWRRRALTEAV